jgi:hypothetical protein
MYVYISDGNMAIEEEMIDEEEEADESTRDNLTVSDRFMLDVLKCCTRISHLELHMHKITDMSGTVIFQFNSLLH